MGVAEFCCSKVDPHLKNQMNRSETGTIIKFSGEDKALFVQKILGKSLEKTKIQRLQPETVNSHTGFLYKPGILFYQGHLSMNDSMVQQGRLALIPRKIEYKGEFMDNQFQGKGTLTIEKQSISLKGSWERGKPKDISFTVNQKNYKIKFKDAQNPYSNINNLQGIIYYPDLRIYQGFFKYDPVLQRYFIEGRGKLIYPNGNTLQGQFKEGNLNGKGKFMSKQGNYEGDFQDGKFHGQGKFTFPGGPVLTIAWVKNKPHLKGTIQIRGTSHEIYYENGVRQLVRTSRI